MHAAIYEITLEGHGAVGNKIQYDTCTLTDFSLDRSLSYCSNSVIPLLKLLKLLNFFYKQSVIFLFRPRTIVFISVYIVFRATFCCFWCCFSWIKTFFCRRNARGLRTKGLERMWKRRVGLGRGRFSALRAISFPESTFPLPARGSRETLTLGTRLRFAPCEQRFKRKEKRLFCSDSIM